MSARCAADGNRDPARARTILSLVYALPLTLAAVGFLRRGRVFVIDPDAGTLLTVERGFFGRARRRRVPPENVRVSTTSAVTALSVSEIEVGRVFWIWLDMPDGFRLHVAGPLSSREAVRGTVERLREDLGA